MSTDLTHAALNGAELAVQGGSALRGAAGNTGRRYSAIAMQDRQVALVVVSAGGQYRPTLGAVFSAANAVTLGVGLLQAGALVDVTDHSHDPMNYPAQDLLTRGWTARLGAADTGRTRRVLLRVVKRDGTPRPIHSDAFTATDATELGAALIAAAGHTNYGGTA